MGNSIVCPWHGWQFDVETGRSTLVPNVSIRTYRVTVDGSDVYVELGGGE
jgi:nitrite reductase/ring-hydroxylating ferredoxin subunit